MPRVKRSTLLTQAGINQIQPIARQVIEWETSTTIRVRCPCCGLLASADLIQNGPYGNIDVFLQRFGGSYPSPTGRIKQRPGLMEYIAQPDEVDKWCRILVEKLGAALKLLKEE